MLQPNMTEHFFYIVVRAAVLFHDLETETVTTKTNL